VFRAVAADSAYGDQDGFRGELAQAGLPFVMALKPRRGSWAYGPDAQTPIDAARALERGVFCSLDELTSALEEWIKLWNEGARPFKWTKTADQIIDRICRYCSRISEPAH
jgi:SRSO17 transposase